jgi:hypothetical protein
MGMADNLLRERPRSSLLDKLDAKPVEQAAPPPSQPVASPLPASADPDCLPKAGSAYEARSRLSNKPELMLTLLLKDGSRQGFSYGDLRHIEYRPTGGSEGLALLLLRFIGVADVRLEGRNLDALHDDIRRQLVGWVRERPAGRDYVEDRNAVVVTGVGIEVAE